MDVIQLTAQFVANNGRSFLTGIANRESKNPMFEFLKPTHHLFSHFTVRARQRAATAARHPPLARLPHTVPHTGPRGRLD